VAEQVMDDQGVLREVVSRKEAIERGMKVYFTGKKCKLGHLSEKYVGGGCVECKRIRDQSDEKKEYKKQYYKDNVENFKEYRKQYYKDNAEQIKQYYKDNAEQIKQYRKQYYKDNAEQIKEQQKQYRQDNAEQIKEQKKQYYKDNAEQIKEAMKQYFQENKEQRYEYYRNRYVTDESFKTACICRSMLRRTLNATNSTKDTSTYEALGYCNDELKQNIESKLLQGMSWDNYGEWHIDHKYPVSRYVQNGITDPSVINSLDNLIPMWDHHNMSKSAMTLDEFLEMEEELAEMYGEFLE